MAEQYNTSAPRMAVKVPINSDLLRKARELNIDLSATLEQALKDELSKRESAQWVEENRVAIKSYNDFVEQHGCFGDEFREF
ncbi:type II toxin-antitoxin system CcdA family antitoxin [Marinobacter sp.]|uniref:type II toxin-antitoxin system CcdA family antitoxin n=1 Tax=Marinobacter sp. TaxID=50741 RepID=UPI003BA9B050